MDKRLTLTLVLVVLLLGCNNPEVEETTTTTQATTTTTAQTTTSTTTTQATTTTTTTIVIPQITTTTTTTTTVIYSPTTTIAGAACYLNSDCGEQRVGYYCKVDLVGGAQPTSNNTRTVYRYTYTPICLDPGTPLARCKELRAETPWDECVEDEECIEDCYTCVPEGGSCPG